MEKGIYRVSTEGDAEGRSMKTLGIFDGYIDEIAFHLANKCYYVLHFERYVPNIQTGDFQPTGKEVHVSIGSDVFDLEEIRRKFEGRKVTISDSNYYKSFRIESDENVEKQIALNKLTPREKKLLNLE